MKMDIPQFNFIADNIFAPIYPVIAEDIIKKTGITQGKCIDLGTGTGKLGLAIADLNTNMNVVLYDISDEILTIADKNIQNRHLVSTKQGAVENLPFTDNSMDLAISRGSLYFWNDKVQAFKEIYRILRPGGYAYIGGGFGTTKLMHQIEEKMKKTNSEWFKGRNERKTTFTPEYLTNITKKADIPNTCILKEEAGTWVFFRK